MAVTDFLYSETDRGFGRVGVSLRALPLGPSVGLLIDSGPLSRAEAYVALQREAFVNQLG